MEKAPERSGAFAHEAGDKPAFLLHLWPYRSLPRRGFVWFIGGTAALLGMPLLAVIGSPVLWGLLPFLAIALAGLWWGLSRSYRDSEIVEELSIWSDRIALVRHEGRGRLRDWAANPYWVEVLLDESAGPVPHYLTLKGAGREVELGTFLSPEERVTLARDLRHRLARIRQAVRE